MIVKKSVQWSRHKSVDGVEQDSSGYYVDTLHGRIYLQPCDVIIDQNESGSRRIVFRVNYGVVFN